MKNVGSASRCSEGCNRPRFVLVNGEEREFCCEPTMQDRLLDLVENNEEITFRSRLRADKLIEVSVS